MEDRELAWMEQIADLQASLKKVVAERAALRTEVERLKEDLKFAEGDAAAQRVGIEQECDAKLKAREELKVALLQVADIKDRYGSCEQCDGSTDAGVLCVACWNRVNIQLSEVTAQRDRLRDMLNDIRRLLLCPPKDLESQIFQRIEDGTPIEKPNSDPYRQPKTKDILGMVPDLPEPAEKPKIETPHFVCNKCGYCGLVQYPHYRFQNTDLTEFCAYHAVPVGEKPKDEPAFFALCAGCGCRMKGVARQDCRGCPCHGQVIEKPLCECGKPKPCATHRGLICIHCAREKHAGDCVEKRKEGP